MKTTLLKKNEIFIIVKKMLSLIGIMLLSLGFMSAVNSTNIRVNTSSFKVLIDITFVYHDEEGVVKDGETVFIAGDFNGWNSSANQLTNNNDGTYSVIISISPSNIQYKYVVNDGSDQWDFLNGSVNRAYTVSNTATKDDYRSIDIGWANLNNPITLNTSENTATDNITGQVYINNVTNPEGEGRGIKAQVGYGTDETPANWTNWENMTYDSQSGNNDVFVGTLTPTTQGSYKYTTRYNGNWGANNPNSLWAYADDRGVLTVSTATSINDTEQEHATIYSHGSIIYINLVSAQASTICVFDLSGRKVKEFQSSVKTVQINDLNEGTYIVRVNSDKGTAVQKVFVK